MLRSAAAAAAGRAYSFPRHLSPGGLSEAVGARREPELERTIPRARIVDVQQRLLRALRPFARIRGTRRRIARRAPRSRRGVLRRREPLDREDRLSKPSPML